MAETVNAPAAAVDEQAELNWRRYEYIKQRGHRRYTYHAARLENFYFGGDTTHPHGYRGDGQWLEDDVEALTEGGRPSYTVNEIKPGVNSAIGYQIHNRLDVSYRPRGGLSDMDKAAIRSKVMMQILDSNKFHWLETQVFGDGLIEQRGYFDMRMNFDTNVFGDIKITVEDPRDVAPDPDAKTYSPDGWSDVTVTRWYTADEIEQHYGPAARAKATQYKDNDGDWGTHDDSGPRNKFGDSNTMGNLDSYLEGKDGLARWRIVDRQRWVYQLTPCAVYHTGDVRPVPNATPEQIAGYQAEGAVIQNRMQKQVRWVVSTRWATLHDQISPYDRFTIIPYFCYFRRGRTAGKVDDAIDPQQILNKSISSYVHIINSAANSGWISEQNSLVNMQNEDLETEGAKTGLNIIVKEGRKYPEKIKPADIPTGVDRLIDRAYTAIKNATVPDAMRGTQGQEISGVAIQSKQFASQQELAMPLDNLTHTREMVADFGTFLMERYYTNERIFRITETDPRTGKEVSNEYAVNRWNEATQSFENDLTEGTYDTVIDSVPMQVTFENSQFTQAMEIKKVVPSLPDRVIVKNSNLADKADILEAMEAQSKGDPIDEAKAALMQAQAALAQASQAKAEAEAANTRATTLFALVQTAKEVAASTAVGPVADQLAGTVGFIDQNAPPVIAPVPAGLNPGPALPQNTSPQFPLSPTSPELGARAGIEGGAGHGEDFRSIRNGRLRQPRIRPAPPDDGAPDPEQPEAAQGREGARQAKDGRDGGGHEERPRRQPEDGR